MVTMENYEEYMMLQADGELDEAGHEALQAFLEEHPELAGELTLYESLRLEPDTTMVYAGKETLLQPVPAKRIIPLNWRTMAAAAGVVAVVSMLAWKYQRPGTDTGNAGTLAGTWTPQTETTQPVPRQIPSATEDTQKQVVPQPTVKTYMAAVKKSPGKPGTHEQMPVVPVQAEQQLAALEPLPAQSLTTEQAMPGLEMQTLPVAAGAHTKSIADNTEKHLLAWLPLTEEKKQGLNMIKEAIDERVAQVKELNNNIKETTLVLNIGNKGITLNF